MPRPARHKESLVNAAVRLFRRKGYAATGLSEILELSGAPRGSLYHHFPGGKEDLGAAAVTAAGRVVTASLEGLAESSDSFPEFVLSYCDLLVGWLEASDFGDGCPIATTLLEMSSGSDAIRGAGAAALDEWVRVCAGVLEREGSRPGAARQRSLALIASVEGALLLAQVHRDAAAVQAVRSQFAPAERLDGPPA